MTVVIYHNPNCGTSRNVLAFIRHAGIEPKVVEYLKKPPSRDALKALIAASGLSVHDLMRKKGTPYEGLKLDNPALTDDERIAVMLAVPILINRPLVDTGAAVRLCRPSDVVLDLLPVYPKADFYKEDGAPFLADARIGGGEAGLAAALEASGLPSGDLCEPGRIFHAFRTLAGTPVGYGGFETYGTEALIRSVVVAPGLRGRMIGRNLVALLLYRAFAAGGRRAWLFTASAATFFEEIGFKAVLREDAPQSILSTRQAEGLCPASAKLLCRTIGF